MIISSRTPEGDPNTCPVCLKELQIDPSTVPTRDAPCPHCGHLLQFDKQPELDDLFAPPIPSGVTSSFEKMLLEFGRAKLGTFPFELHDKLLETIAELAIKRRLPPADEVPSIINSANNWQEAIDLLLQCNKPKPKQRRFPKSLQAFFAKITGNT
jgi:hypothetical protein